jgi:hypothetical protein
MPSAEPDAAKVVFWGPNSASDYLAAGVRLCEQARIPFYFLVGQEFSTQAFGELKNPHLRFCGLCVYITQNREKSEEVEVWRRGIVDWLAEHNPSARVIGYEICTGDVHGRETANRQVSLPADFAAFLERDLREAGFL